MPRNLLVTGGAGFIGGNFVHHWRRHHSAGHVVVLDALTYAGNLSTLAPHVSNGAVEFVHGDILDSALVVRVLQAFEIDTIVHFAAESHVDRSIVDPAGFVRTNVLGTHVLLEACRQLWYHQGTWRPEVRFHHVSTDEVYGSLTAHDLPFTESSPYSPNSPYAASKAGADHLVRAYHSTYGMPVSISNCSNNYGPFHYPEKLIPLLIVNALVGKPLPIYGDGLQIRDWLFVNDHCVAIEKILRAPTEGETFNIGGRAEARNIDIVRLVCAEVDERVASDSDLQHQYPECPASRGGTSASLIRNVEDRLGHDRRYAVDPSLIETRLAFAAYETLQSGLAKTVAWYLSNEPWWKPLLKARDS